MHRVLRDIAIFKQNSTAVWPHKSNYKIKRGRFTSTIWAEQSNNFPSVHMDIDPIHNRSTTVNFNKFISAKNRLFHFPGSREDRSF